MRRKKLFPLLFSQQPISLFTVSPAPLMAETGYDRFPGSLDPRAQEFRPSYSFGTPLFLPPQQPHHQLFFSPYPPPSITELPVLPFHDGAFPHFPAAPPPPPAPAAVSLPTRSLLLSLVPRDVSETIIRRELEGFGDVRGVEMERVSEGIVIVHFYDIRESERALREIRDQHMQQQCRLRNYYNGFHDFHNPVSGSGSGLGLVCGHAVWAQFIIPASNAVPNGQNQGTIVVFNLDSDVSSSCLGQIFEAFGPVKELRETPLKKQQKFVEFFDIRDASEALKEMNGKEINGKSVVIEFSRPGGHGNKFLGPGPTICSNNMYPRSLKCPPPRPPPPPPPPRKFSGGAASDVPSSRWYYSKAQSFSRKLNSGKGSQSPNNLKKSLGSSDVSGKMASLNLDEIDERESCGSLRKNSKKIHSNLAVAADQQQQQLQPSRSKLRKCRQSKKFDTRFLINDNATVDSHCRDLRTTVMIKNIPNKYSQKLLLNMLDNHCIHCNEQMGGGDEGSGDDDNNRPLSSYDFVYLPIDFNNKCNVGYGFVNMTSPEATWRLYKAFHLQPWEVFNSRKICEVTYARVQGLEALKEHFKNSKFPCEMDHYLPVVFSPPRDGKQLTEPLPVGGQKQPILIGLPSPSSDQDETNGVDGVENYDVTDEVMDHENILIGNDDSSNSSSGSSSSSRNSQNNGVVDDNDDGYSNYQDY